MDNYIVFYSGGISSFYATLRLLEYIPKNKVILLFTDTRTEDEDLYRFLVETSNYLDIPLTWLKDGRNIWEVMKDERFLGNSRFDPCSRVLKRSLAKNYIKLNYKPRKTTLVFGIDWSESHRCEAIVNNQYPYSVLFPLCDKPFIPYSQYFDIVNKLGIKPPKLYSMGFTHNNCGGFCVKAGKAHFKNLLDKMPDRYIYHEKEEQKLIEFLSIQGKGLLKTTKDGVRSYITLKQFRETLETISDDSINEDVGGCTCFA